MDEYHYKEPTRNQKEQEEKDKIVRKIQKEKNKY
jgi:hypothetical protein